MCQLCADDRALEPHPPLHLWNRGIPTYLHIHQQRLEGRGECKDIYCFPSGIYSESPSAVGLESFVLINISGLQTRTLICLWFSSCSLVTFSNLFLCIHSLSNLPPQDYLFRLVPGYVDSGKGKCSYDPKQENIAVLISKRCFFLQVEKKNLPIKKSHSTESHKSPFYLLIFSPLQMVTYMQGSI